MCLELNYIIYFKIPNCPCIRHVSKYLQLRGKGYQDSISLPIATQVVELNIIKRTESLITKKPYFLQLNKCPDQRNHFTQTLSTEQTRLQQLSELKHFRIYSVHNKKGRGRDMEIIYSEVTVLWR